MISNLRYDFWDVLKAPRLALSGKSLLAQARPLIYGYLAYLILTYLALLIDGRSISSVWNEHLLFPFVNLDLSHWYTKGIWVLGLVAVAVFYSYGNLTVAKLAHEELKGNPFFPRRGAAAEAYSNLRPLWVAGGLLLLLIVMLSLIQGVIGVVARIPYVGEIVYSIIYAVPFFLWSLFVVFIAFGLTTAVLTLPAIVTAREKDAFGATFYVYNTIWTQPLRWLSQTAVGLAMAKIGVFVLGYFFMRALQLTTFTTSLFGGDKVKGIVSGALSGLAPIGNLIGFFTSLYPGSKIDWLPIVPNWTELNLAAPSTTANIASLIILLTFVIVWIVVISYGLNIITYSQLLAFIYIRYCQDGEKLGESPAVGKDDPRELIPRRNAGTETNP